MNIKLDDIKRLIAKAIEKCPSLVGCRITDAYPPKYADSPVKRSICAVGLLQAQRVGKTGLGAVSETENSVTAFADIYTPVARGGQYSSDCALEMCNALGYPYNSGTVTASADKCEYLSSCCAYRTRVKITASRRNDGYCNGEIDGAFNLFFDDSPYVCRRVSFELSPALIPVECYGEVCPTAYADGGRKCTVRVVRCIGDDGRTLRSLSYPFTLSDLTENGFTLSDCAVVNYECDENMQETVTIYGRNEEYDG